MMVYAACAYLIFMSVLGFGAMGDDKRRARHGSWRIRETTLLALAFLGGGIGSLLGMYVFHHKTKHKKFRLWLPVAALLYMVIAGRLIILIL